MLPLAGARDPTRAERPAWSLSGTQAISESAPTFGVRYAPIAISVRLAGPQEAEWQAYSYPMITP
jgi:hypothetical protein